MPEGEVEDSKPLPLPKYFAQLYSEIESLKSFDLKDVIYDRKTQELFLEQVRYELEKKDSITQLKKQEIWEAIK